MHRRDHIFLVGAMGAGKSTLGAALAARLGLGFIDLDARIVAAAGMTIPAIFDCEGEAGFRTRETRALHAALMESPSVVATGGGVVLHEANRTAMRGAGLVVYLHVSADEQLRRVAGDGNRPLLATADPAQRLAQLQAQREPLYRDIADIILSTDAQTPEQLAAALVLRLATTEASP